MGWKKEHGGHIPHHAVLAGYDKDGSPLYVGRAHHRGDVIPGKVRSQITSNIFSNVIYVI